MSVVTISRQVGSWGDHIAELVAQKLGLDLITRERLNQMGQECDQDFAKACTLFVEETPQSFWDRIFFSGPAHRALFESLNYDLALRGDVLIMGRGAQIALPSLPGILKVRLVAPFELRVERIMKERGIDYDEAEQFVTWYGKHRRNLVESVYHVDLSDPELFDMVINTEHFDPQGVAEVICCTAQEKNRNLDPQALNDQISRLALAKKIEIHIIKGMGHPLLQTFRWKPARPGRSP